MTAPQHSLFKALKGCSYASYLPPPVTPSVAGGAGERYKERETAEKTGKIIKHVECPLWLVFFQIIKQPPPSFLPCRGGREGVVWTLSLFRSCCCGVRTCVTATRFRDRPPFFPPLNPVEWQSDVPIGPSSPSRGGGREYGRASWGKGGRRVLHYKMHPAHSPQPPPPHPEMKNQPHFFKRSLCRSFPRPLSLPPILPSPRPSLPREGQAAVPFSSPRCSPCATTSYPIIITGEGCMPPAPFAR